MHWGVGGAGGARGDVAALGEVGHGARLALQLVDALSDGGRRVGVHHGRGGGGGGGVGDVFDRLRGNGIEFDLN